MNSFVKNKNIFQFRRWRNCAGRDRVPSGLSASLRTHRTSPCPRTCRASHRFEGDSSHPKIGRKIGNPPLLHDIQDKSSKKCRRRNFGNSINQTRAFSKFNFFRQLRCRPKESLDKKHFFFDKASCNVGQEYCQLWWSQKRNWSLFKKEDYILYIIICIILPLFDQVCRFCNEDSESFSEMEKNSSPDAFVSSDKIALLLKLVGHSNPKVNHF